MQRGEAQDANQGLPITITMCNLILVLASALAFAGKTPSNLPVTTYVADYV
jgi:hypothetical protein